MIKLKGTLSSYFNKSIQEFFNDCCIRSLICEIASECSGEGGVGTLQSVTTGTGDNITSNALQVIGFDNLDTSILSTVLFHLLNPILSQEIL